MDLLRRLVRTLTTPFRPPFHGLPVIVWLYFVASFLLHPAHQIWSYNFVDSDDYLYLTQAIDWLRGQGWYDLIQHRMNPPDGTLIHFSHIMNVIYGVPIAVLSHSFSPVDAATLTAAVYPLLFLAGFLFTAIWATHPFMNEKWTGATAWVALFSLSIMFQFAPGRVDHHGLEALFAIAAFGFVARMIIKPGDTKAALAAGIILAFAMAIALEIMPVLLIMTVWIGLWSVLEGKKAARAGFLFSGALCAGSVLCLLLAQPPSRLLVPNIAIYSVIHVAVTAVILACFSGMWLAGGLSRTLRIIIANGLILAAALAFLVCFSGIMEGFPDITPKLVLAHAWEAHPLFEGGPYTHAIFLPIFALLSLGVFLFYRKKWKDNRWLLGLLLLLTGITLLLSIVSQQRMMVYAETFSIIPLTLMLQRAWIAAAKMDDRLLAAGTRVLAVLLTGPLTVILLPAAAGQFQNGKDLLFFPVQITEKLCDQNRLVNVLDTTYGDHPRLIMSTIGQSAELLFRTPHAVIGAPFHLDIGGLADDRDFFMATDPAAAEKIVRQRGIGLVVVCDKLEDIYRTPGEDDDDDVATAQDSGDGTLIHRLTSGYPPKWLKPVDAGQLGNMLLFEVKRPRR